MEAAWKSMEKKEKIPWIKKAAEDQKRYEVQYQPVVSEPLPPPPAEATVTQFNSFYTLSCPFIRTTCVIQQSDRFTGRSAVLTSVLLCFVLHWLLASCRGSCRT